jgi:hypothetical protein
MRINESKNVSIWLGQAKKPLEFVYSFLIYGHKTKLTFKQEMQEGSPQP